MHAHTPRGALASQVLKQCAATMMDYIAWGGPVITMHAP